VHRHGGGGPNLTDADVLLNPFPMVTWPGSTGCSCPGSRWAGCLVQHHPFDLGTFLRQIEQHRATYTCAPPALLTALLAQRGAASADRHLLAAHPRLRVDAAGAQPAAGLARHLRHRDHQLLRLQRGHRAARHAEGHPRPGCRARQYFPRYGVRDWDFTMASTTLARIVDPQTGAEITEAGRAWRAAHLRARRVPRVPAGQRRARPVRRGTATSGPGTSWRSPATTWSTCTTSTGPGHVVRGGMKHLGGRARGFISGHPKVADVGRGGLRTTCSASAPAGRGARPGEPARDGDARGDSWRTCGTSHRHVFKRPERPRAADELPRNPLARSSSGNCGTNLRPIRISPVAVTTDCRSGYGCLAGGRECQALAEDQARGGKAVIYLDVFAIFRCAQLFVALHGKRDRKKERIWRRRWPALAASIPWCWAGRWATAHPASGRDPGRDLTGQRRQRGADPAVLSRAEHARACRPGTVAPQISGAAAAGRTRWRAPQFRRHQQQLGRLHRPGPGGAFTSAAASWTEPTGRCTGRDGRYSAFWVGLDGYTSPTWSRSAPRWTATGSTRRYYAWYRDLPGRAVKLSQPGQPRRPVLRLGHVPLPPARSAWS